MFRPGSKVFICAPKINQGAKIAKEKIIEIYRLFPLLRREIIGGDLSNEPGSFQKDQVTLKFRNGSVFDVVSSYDSQRGGRRNSGLIDEVRDHNGDELNQVVLPLLNVSRRMVNGDINENEPHQCQYFMTSASEPDKLNVSRFINDVKSNTPGQVTSSSFPVSELYFLYVLLKPSSVY